MTRLIILTLLIFSFIGSAKAFDQCPLSGGLPPIPNALTCSFGKAYNAKICDNSCNCYWVTQCG